MPKNRIHCWRGSKKAIRWNEHGLYSTVRIQQDKIRQDPNHKVQNKMPSLETSVLGYINTCREETVASFTDWPI